MVEVTVNIDADAIQQHVVQAILDSAIGKEIKSAIEASVRNLGGYDGAIRRVVEQEVYQVIKNVVGKDFRTMIETKVKESLSSELVTSIIDSAWKHLMEKVGRY